MPEDIKPSEWITTKEAAELTGYTPRYFRKAANRGLVEAAKWGRDWFLKREGVLSYAEEMKKLGPAKHDPRRAITKEARAEN